MTLQELAKKHGELVAIKVLQVAIRSVESRPQALQWHALANGTLQYYDPFFGPVDIDTALEGDRRLIDTAIARNKLQGYTPKGNL